MTDSDPAGGWRFAQCFGDKGEVEEITEGELTSTLEA
jgi:serine/threonine-protein phosphatase 2A regulatory subunit B